MSRSSFAILFITPTKLARADFAGGGGAPKLIELTETPRPAVEDLVMLAETAFRATGQKTRRVYVLDSEVWTQTLSLPTHSVAGVTGDALTRALSFEAEALSGVSSADSALAARDLGKAETPEGAQAVFWTTQVSRHDMERLDEAFRRLGAKLAGVTHPAGVSASLGNGKGAWQRLELWNDAIVQRNGAGRVEITNSDPRFAAWQPTLQSMVESSNETASRVELLVSDTALAGGLQALSSAEGVAITDLSQREALSQWLTAWASKLQDGDVPMVQPESRPVSSKVLAAASILLLIGSLVGCFFLQRHFDARLANARGGVKQLEGVKKQVAAAQKSTTDLRGEVDQLDKQVERLNAMLRKRRHEASVHTRRWHALLDVLAKRTPRDVVIEKLTPVAGGLTVQGVCLRDEDANALAATVADAMRQNGWRVHPPEKKALTLRPDGGPWRFEMRLSDMPIAPPTNGVVTQGDASRVVDAGEATREGDGGKGGTR